MLPGSASPSPYTNSAADAPMSGLTVVLIAKRAQGSFQNQFSLSSRTVLLPV